jgi:hypothetical protein
MSKRIHLSKSAIESIFQLRLDGHSFKDIAACYPCSDHYIRQIISREVASDVELDAGLVHGAQNAKVKYRPRKKTIKPVEDKFAPLARLMEAQTALAKAYADCCKAGLSQAFIDLAIKEAGGLE